MLGIGAGDIHFDTGNTALVESFRQKSLVLNHIAIDIRNDRYIILLDTR